VTAALLETKDLTKIYTVNRGLFKGAQSLTAVNGINLSVPQGSVLGLVGESGCGKSTVAKMILRLEAPTSGQIHFDGEDVTDIQRKEMARRVQPVFQDPYASLNPRKSIDAIVSLPLRVHQISDRQKREAKLDEIMEIVGLPPRLRQSYPNQLSGGQRQRVAVARALIMRPEMVICDEPTSALDVSVQSQILNLLMDLQRQFGLTYLFISHDLAVVEHIATQVAVMYLGRIVEQAKTEDLFRQPRHPYTQALLKSVLTPEPRRGLPQTHLGATYPNPIDPPSGCTFHPRCPKADDQCATCAPKPTMTADRLVECHYPLFS